MLTKNLAALAALALLAGSAGGAAADPNKMDGAMAGAARAAAPIHSPVPAAMRGTARLILVRDVRQMGNGGGCWNHCYSIYDECLNMNDKTNNKNICVARIKTCMETCDRLSGLGNPTQR